MRLGLTNTIAARGTPVGGDGLALDLQFAADKTLTARRGPTPILTRGSTGTFVGSNGLIQTAAVNAARFDHDPANPTICRGLLIEEGRTNLLVQSENFGTTWASVNLNQTGTPPYLNVATAPDGATTADKLIENTVNGGHGVDQSVTFTAAAHTFSVYAKAAERSWLRMTIASVSNSTWFDVANGTVGTIGAGVTASIQNAGNGWWRCSVTFTTTAGSLQNFIRIATGNNNTTYAGDGTSGILVWGAQLEAGSFATSYIPTTTSALARSADVCSITGTNFTGMYNPLEGSLFTSAIFNAPVAYGTGQLIVDINDTTTTNRLRYFRNANTGFSGFANTSGNSLNVALTSTGAAQPLITQKYSAGFKLDDYVFYVNNAQIGTDNLGALLVSPTTMTIGDASAGSPRQHINGTISAIRYYRKRLDNSKLASLTV